MEKKNKALLLFGIFNAVSEVLFFILSMQLYSFFAGLLVYSFFADSLLYPFLGGLLVLASCFLASPIFCIMGIVQGIRYRKKPYALACIVLSMIGLLLFAAMTGLLLTAD